ncbi:accessory gene regulator ArgB-like protein [Lysinibacillus sp. NPDC048646]|uniref:accessory gene regulator ArgB-like protein n=1 Tax=Lysinibacillus sp. NPDC048646 TaxID=3390574 RepID=UPI003D06B19B
MKTAYLLAREGYWIYKLENALFNLLNQEDYSILEREKLKFGIKIILSEFNKLLIIYAIAFLLDCVIPTLITHLTFFFLRQVCFGYHFKNLYICIGWSIFAFPITVHYLAESLTNFSTTLLFILFCITCLLLYKLAPKGTENQPIINQNHLNHLRDKMKLRLLVIVGLFFLSPFKIKVFIEYGVFLESIMLLLQITRERH